jgi:hypothetical protein
VAGFFAACELSPEAWSAADCAYRSADPVHFLGIGKIHFIGLLNAARISPIGLRLASMDPRAATVGDAPILGGPLVWRGR